MKLTREEADRLEKWLRIVGRNVASQRGWCFGTTGCVSLKHHRRYIGIELNPEYVDLAVKRIIEENKQTDFLDALDAK